MPPSATSPFTLVGQSDAHLCPEADAALLGALLHRDVLDPFGSLAEAAGRAGFALTILSAFRDFPRQLSIWNRKATGALPVLDSSARPIDISTLSDHELVFAILRWSALPGASRHHWGTDIDVYDAARTPEGYEVQLIPAEVDPGGMHAPLHEWLDVRIASGTSFGFHRPYDADRGGVAPERWHLSFAPIATEYATLLTPDLLRATLTNADMRLKDVVLEHLDEIFDRFITNVSQPPFPLA